DIVGTAGECFAATACLRTFAAALRICAGVSMLAEGGAAIGMDVGSTVAIGGLVGVVGPSTSWTLLDGEGDGASCDRNDSLEVGVTAIGTDTPVLKRAEPEGGGVCQGTPDSPPLASSTSLLSPRPPPDSLLSSLPDSY